MLRQLATIVLAIALATPAMAFATDVIGNINVDTRWTPQGSPYVLTGDVTVAPQATLTIEPGVVVQAAASDALGAGNNTNQVELVVRGALVADGKPSTPVTFRGASEAAGAWYGISFEPGARASSLTNVVVSDAYIAVWSRTTSALQLADLRIIRPRTGVLWQATPGPTLTRVEVDGATDIGIRLEDDGASGAAATLVGCRVTRSAQQGIRVTPRVAATVRGTHLILNKVGIEAVAGASLTFANNVVAANTQSGVALTQSETNPFTLLNNTIDHNVATLDGGATSAGRGIHVLAVTQPPAFVIRNNLVTNHGTAGIQVDGGTQPSLDHNNVWGNAANYQGAAAGTGSISANPLYVAPLGQWTFVAVPVTWNDTGSFSGTRTFEHTGAGRIRLRFGASAIYGSAGHDEVRLYERSGSLLRTYYGSFSGPSPTAAGDYLRLSYFDDGAGHTGTVRVDGFEWQHGLDGYNYRLQGSSPAIDVGNDLGAPTADADGTARPYDGDVNGTPTTDIGAYEWHQNIAPLALAGADRIVLPGTHLAFDGSGSRDPDGRIVSWDWDFGDGSAHADTPSPTHSFASVGTYTVTLTITDDQGASAADTATVTVADNLPPTANAGTDQFVDVGEAVTLDGGASGDPDGTLVSYAWDFGDGAPAGSGPTVTHAWATAGVYTVTLTVTDDRGATATDTASIVVGTGGGGNQAPVARAGGPYTANVGSPISFDGSASADADGTVTSFAWEFGDGQSGTGAMVSHSYAGAGTYLVRLTVTDNQGATDDDTALVTVSAPGNQPPVAKAGGNRSAAVGEAVAFDGSTSSDPDGTIAAYAWDFGDGTAGTGAQLSHAYSGAGTYLVRLTVTDDAGAVGQDIAVVVVGAPQNQAPVARAGGNRQASVGAAVAFDGRASSDPDGSIASYAWEFGDGGTGTGAQVTHAYAAAGSFLVRLTVTDDRGATAQDFALVVVGGGGSTTPNQDPVAAAGPDQSVNAGAPVVVNAAGSSDADGTLIAYQWDFGDGSTATGISASHVYVQGGSYTVTLTVIDDRAARASDTLRVQVNGRPTAVPGPARSTTVGEAVTFDGGGSRDADGQVVSYEWDFGDGTRAQGQVVSHAYTTSGVFTVQLTVTDDGGATGTATAQVVASLAADTPQQPPASGGCNAAGGGSAAGGLPLLLLALGVFARRRRSGR